MTFEEEQEEEITENILINSSSGGCTKTYSHRVTATTRKPTVSPRSISRLENESPSNSFQNSSGSLLDYSSFNTTTTKNDGFHELYDKIMLELFLFFVLKLKLFRTTFDEYVYSFFGEGFDLQINHRIKGKFYLQIILIE